MTLFVSSCGSSPAQDPVQTDSPLASATPTATQLGAPMTRITTVPKATPSPISTQTPASPTAQQTMTPTQVAVATRATPTPTTLMVKSDFAAPTPTATAVPVTAGPSADVPSPLLIDVGVNTATPTATSLASATTTPTAVPTFKPTPTGPGAAATTTPTPIPIVSTVTPSATPEPDDDGNDVGPAATAYPPTLTPTPIPGDVPEGTSFSHLTHLYWSEHERNFLSLWGEVFNNTGADQYLLTVAARVYDQGGTLIADGYNTSMMLPVTTLVQGRKMPFELQILLPEREFDLNQLRYECYVETMDAWYGMREDLTILNHSWTVTGEGYEITGTVQNRGPALSSFIKVIATLYDADGNVVGVSWFNEITPSFLAPGVVEFTIVAENVAFEAASYELQVLGR
jgi:hypothetical protein